MRRVEMVRMTLMRDAIVSDVGEFVGQGGIWGNVRDVGSREESSAERNDGLS